MAYKNHLIDPTFFYDAIDEFTFEYDFFFRTGDKVDDYGRKYSTFENTKIYGSLQTQGLRTRPSQEGNSEDLSYSFYCKSLYRINIGDIIKYNGNYLRVNQVHEYDAFGVRECDLTMIDPAAYKDFNDYLAYIYGEKIV